MEKINIETAQNVTIDYNIASLGERILANIIDYLIIAVYYIFTIILFFQSANKMFDSMWVFMLASLPPMVYQLLCEVFMNGQSFGMKAMNTKVIRLDGREASLGNYLLRWVLRPVDIFFTNGAVAIITILINGKGQRLGDIAAGTTVVKFRKDVNLSDTIFTKTNEDYQVTYPDVVQLTDKDMAVIKEVLSIYRKTGRVGPVKKLTIKLKQILKIEHEVDAIKFLQTLLKDYNHLTGKFE
ncbi:MAG TPA: RDD family protein [Cytophagaceae bacterium]